MNITEQSRGRAFILTCNGELTADSLDAFKQVVERHLGEEQVVDLVLNLEAVPFIDSAVLEYLLDAQKRSAEKLGHLRLARVNENVAKILEITRLDGVFERFADVSDAVEAT